MDVIKAVVTEVIMNNLIGPRNCEIMQIDDRQRTRADFDHS